MPKIKTKKFPKELIKREKILPKKKDGLALLIVEKAKEKIIPDLIKFFEAQTKEVRNEITELDDFANGLESRISELETQTRLIPPESKSNDKAKGDAAQKKIFETVCQKCGKELKEGHECEAEKSNTTEEGTKQWAQK